MGKLPTPGAVLMGGRRPLKGGAVRLLGNHGGLTGRAFRRAYDALAAEFDLATPLARMEASRVAASWTILEAATRALEAARAKRASGKGRRPGPRELERLARRQGLADGSYRDGLATLRELTRRRPFGPRASLAEQLAAQQDEPEDAS